MVRAIFALEHVYAWIELAKLSTALLKGWALRGRATLG